MEYKWKIIKITRAIYKFCSDGNQNTSTFKTKKEGLDIIERLYNDDLVSAKDAYCLVDDLVRIIIPNLFHKITSKDPLLDELAFLDHLEAVRDSFNDSAFYEALPDLPCFIDSHPCVGRASIFYFKNKETLIRTKEEDVIFSIVFTNKQIAFDWLEAHWNELEDFNDVLFLNRLRLEIDRLSIPLYPIIKRLKFKNQLSEVIKLIPFKN